jgi:hypothetical protein
VGTCDLFAPGISQAGKALRAVAAGGSAGSDPGSLVQPVRRRGIQFRKDFMLSMRAERSDL